MALTTISFLGQSKTQSTQLAQLRATLNELQRQLATQKKTDTFAGFGVDAGRVQSLRTNLNEIDAYSTNIDRAVLRTKVMSETLTEITNIANQVIDGFRLLQSGADGVDTDFLRNMASNNLQYLGDLLNTEIQGSYLFSGNDIGNAPFTNEATLNANMQAEYTLWLAGGQTPAQLLANADAFTGSDLGYAGTLGASGDVIAKVDDNIEINYTLKADNPGLQEIVRGIALAANLQFPNPAVDIATEAEFEQIFAGIISTLESGIAALESDHNILVSKNALMTDIKERQENERNTLQSMLDDLENVDTAEIIVRLQSLETQMTASYETANLVNQLTLVNFL
ncbi:MAG: hypothetical protein EP349_03125 [Alphaproteobacteria bacterium]|nr:MAG: hypothetical protein EP349_03125 [Alphaproteobacteria bacterium]